MKHYEDEGLKLGQVDCIAQGDLCIRLNIEFYPQMKLYEDGQVVESYSSVLSQLSFISLSLYSSFKRRT
jgi:hypothetical protein